MNIDYLLFSRRYSFEQLPWLYFHSCGQTNQGRGPRISLAALNAAYLRRMNAAAFGDFFLSHP